MQQDRHAPDPDEFETRDITDPGVGRSTGVELSNWSAVHEPGRTTVAVSGEIDLESGPKLREFLASQLAHLSEGSLVVDARGVTFCDSSGLQAFVATHRRAGLLGTRMVLLVAPGGRFARFLELAGVTDLFRIEQVAG